MNGRARVSAVIYPLCEGAPPIRALSILLIGLLCAVSLTGCQKTNKNPPDISGEDSGKLTIEMELDEHYSSSDPFVNARLFCVSEDLDVLEAEVSFEMEGGSGLVEIKDNRTDEVFWSNAWSETAEHETTAVSLEHVKTDQEYVIRFTGTKIKHALISITFDSDLVQERVRPLKEKVTH